MARSTPAHSGFTIINGSGSGDNGNRIDVWVEYKIGAADVVNNRTPFEAYFYAALNPSHSSSTSFVNGTNSEFVVNGVAGTGVSDGPIDFRDADILNLLGSYTGNIAHNEDGTKSISISGTFTTKSTYITGGSVSATIDLPTIIRGLVSIDTGSEIVKAIPFIDTGSGWIQAAAYVDNGSTFKLSV